MLVSLEYKNEILEGLSYSKEGIGFAQERIRDLERDNLFLLDLLKESTLIIFKQLNDKQREIFLYGFETLNYREFSLNKLSEKIAKKMVMSFSTAKWNLTKLRDLGFFETLGTRGNTKTTLASTMLGRTLYSLLAHIDRQKL